MIKGDAKYNEHFRNMVTDGLTCGLDHPIEWVIDYSRNMHIDYKLLSEKDEFCSLVWKELYEIFHYRQPKDDGEIKQWVYAHYNNGGVN